MNTNEDQTTITEAQVVAWVRTEARRLLDKYPQTEGVSVSVSVHENSANPGHISNTVHLIGRGFHECGLGTALAECEAQAAAKIETPEKMLANARAEAARAAANLAELERVCNVA